MTLEKELSADRALFHPAYFNTLFRPGDDWTRPPGEFAIITAYATTGESWSDAENRSADEQLRADLQRMGGWLCRLTGFAPDGTHEEPGWSVDLPLPVACELGSKYKQDAIYFVTGDDLFVAHCDERADAAYVGPFPGRLIRAD